MSRNFHSFDRPLDQVRLGLITWHNVSTVVSGTRPVYMRSHFAEKAKAQLIDSYWEQDHTKVAIHVPL